MKKAQTMQQTFDKIIAGLSSQGFKQSMAEERCAYHGEQGMKCAIGHIIDDEYYDEGFESKGFDSREVRKALQDSGVCFNPIFLNRVQIIHDLHRSPCTMIEAFKQMAPGFGLKLPEGLTA